MINKGFPNGHYALRPWLRRDPHSEAKLQAQKEAAYRRLALQLHYDQSRDSSPRSAVIMSPTANSFCASGVLDIAFNFVQELGKSVLLIDGCPERPELTEFLECSTLPGWTDLLRNPQQTFDSVMLNTSAERLHFIPAGEDLKRCGTPEEMELRLKAAHEQSDFVLLYGGSVLDDSSAIAAIPSMGSVLLVVMENETRTEDLKAAQQALVLCKARDVRVILSAPFKGAKSNYTGTEKPQQHRQAIPKLVPE